MKLLLLMLLFSPLAINCETKKEDKKIINPNDEPFLPINPNYQLNTKLTKRGVEKNINEILSHLNADVYPTKNTPNYNENYYHDLQANIPVIQSSSSPQSYDIPSVPVQTILPPVYGPPDQSQRQENIIYSTGQNGYSTYYNNNPTTYNSQQSVSPGQLNQYTVPEMQYYYSINQQPDITYSIATSQDNSEIPTGTIEMVDEKYIKQQQQQQRVKLNDGRTSNNIKDTQFMEGINYITNSQKDLDTQSTTNKQPIAYNLIENQSDLHIRSAQLPSRNIMKYSNNGGQQQIGNYQLPQVYKQQLDQLMSQALANFFMQNGAINQGQNSQYDLNQVQSPVKPLTQPSQVIAKTGLAYVMNPSSYHIVPRHIAKNPSSSQVIQASPSSHGKIRKPQTTVSVEPSQSYYIQPMKSMKHHQHNVPHTTSDFLNYEYPPGMNHDADTVPLFDLNKAIQNYSPSDEVYTTYPGSPVEYNHYYQPRQISKYYKTSLDDGSFKRNSRRSPKPPTIYK
ncbi:hypothetical protein HCN44_002657 [Aphidius gifuensis]|uniref:Uncharacterized protein n=1 Tax=Aphidius gifuensis TaxID=684658 RepID=A0A834XPQ0_APHGI|nr:uncharacterized protein LOC122854528 [Aphidius gifuensis]KAF7991095.1 hypothetical protein HCN44_002657 [Aphidius gifuensis]